MHGTQTHYFVTANSSQGFANLIETNLTGLNRICILKGDFTLLKYDVLSKISDFLTFDGYNCECIRSSFEPECLDGLIVRECGIAVISDRIFPESLLQDDCITYIDIGKYADNFDPNLVELLEKKTLAYDGYAAAYRQFKKAIHVHDEWESIYVEHMDFEKANELTQNTIDRLLKPKASESKGIIRHRFFGGATYKGSFDLVENIAGEFSKRYFVKGRPGSGKSTMLKKIAERASSYGFDVNVYHCGFDSKSLDMVTIKALSICIFDSTAPHEYFPYMPDDEIIDMYSQLIDNGTDERYSEQLSDIKSRYDAFVSDGVKKLVQAKDYEDLYNNQCKRYLIKSASDNLLDELAAMF